ADKERDLLDAPARGRAKDQRTMLAGAHPKWDTAAERASFRGQASRSGIRAASGRFVIRADPRAPSESDSESDAESESDSEPESESDIRIRVRIRVRAPKPDRGTGRQVHPAETHAAAFAASAPRDALGGGWQGSCFGVAAMRPAWSFTFIPILFACGEPP